MLTCLFVSLSQAKAQRDTTFLTTIHFELNSDKIINGDAGYEYLKNNILPYLYRNVDSLNFDSLNFIRICVSSSPEESHHRNEGLTELRFERVAALFVAALFPTDIISSVEKIKNITTTYKAVAIFFIF